MSRGNFIIIIIIQPNLIINNTSMILNYKDINVKRKNVVDIILLEIELYTLVILVKQTQVLH